MIDRMDGVLALLPQAKKQGQERIIGERAVPNAEKILSFYEPQSRVIKRGKAGAQVEFGNVLLLGENPEGLVIDWQLYQERLEQDDVFADCLRRRTQTEGRIAILTNQFLGAPPRAKGFEHRKLAVTWAVLTYNLWIQTRIRREIQARQAEEAAIAA